ncbi:hypothetical protein [Chryseobacterium sp. SIMBA_038]|uniref:hypothetical protein n=1 Tax=Chryseobacterium sp. SIMBA_038 TaxID=3085780 RepID=UPI00397A005F
MIKIELKNVNKILSHHYEILTIKRGKEDTLIDLLDNEINLSATNPDLCNMYKDLKVSVMKDSNQFSILTATPNELQKFRDRFEKDHHNILNTVHTFVKGGKDKTYRDDILKAFYYKNYDKWKAYDLARKISINVCPYCNRNYTFILGTDTKKGTRFEFDHFFDKARYPYLALSFYNLVPSCHICNSNLKGSKKFNLDDNIHPYIEGFSNNIVFSLTPKNINFINGKSSAYRINFRKHELSNINNQKTKAAFKNIKTFRLTELYNLHKDYVNEIIIKSVIYNDDYIKELYDKYNGTLFSSEDDVRRMVFGNYIQENDFSKRPLSKLTRDIASELKLLS